MTKRVCLFSQFDPDSVIQRNVLHYLRALKEAGCEIHLASTNDHLTDSDREALEAVCETVHLRPNIGLDFGSWQYLLQNTDAVREADWVLIANDSVLGPFHPLPPIFDTMEASGADFWGITDNFQIDWHIQSYFISYSRRVVQSPAFQALFGQDFAAMTKDEIIANGELAVTQRLTHAGFKGGAHCPVSYFENDNWRPASPGNPTHSYWKRTVLEQGCPFIKKQLLRDNPLYISGLEDWPEVVAAVSDYDLSMIDEYLASTKAITATRAIIEIWRQQATPLGLLKQRIKRLPHFLSLFGRAAWRIVRKPRSSMIALERFMAMPPEAFFDSDGHGGKTYRRDWKKGPVKTLPHPFCAPAGGVSIKPLNFQPTEVLRSKPALNVLIPNIQVKSFAGGLNTVFNLTYRLAAEGVPVRYFSTQCPVERNGDALWDHLTKLTGISERFEHVSFEDGHDREKNIPIGPNDLFFATAWWTAHIANAALERTENDRFLYMIQDVETGFHAWDSLYALAEETYAMPFYGIFNESFLPEHLVRYKVGNFANPSYVENHCSIVTPAVDRTRFYWDTAARAKQGKRQLLFYARPHVAPRNLYEIGLAALKQCVDNGVFPADEWELAFIGDNLPDFEASKDQTITQMPWMAFEDYTAMMRSADICLALMLSPHTGYPVLEMAACGGIGVTNTFSVKTQDALSALSPNILAGPPTVSGVAASLTAAVARLKDETARQQASTLPFPATWDDALRDVQHDVLSFIHDHQTTALKGAA